MPWILENSALHALVCVVHGLLVAWLVNEHARSVIRSNNELEQRFQFIFRQLVPFFWGRNSVSEQLLVKITVLFLEALYKGNCALVRSSMMRVLINTNLCSKSWSFSYQCWCVKVLWWCLHGRGCGCLALWQPGHHLHRVVLNTAATLISWEVGLGLSTTIGQRLDV